MRALIFANGAYRRAPDVRPGDLLIAADGGARYCLAAGLSPALVIGDLDSLTETEVDACRSLGAQILQYPPEKDFTDLELALQFVRTQNAEEVWIVGALGARWDQSFANLLLPVVFPDLKLRLVDGEQEFFFIRSGEQLEVEGQPGDLLSLIPLAGDAQGVQTHGLQYPLNGESLIFGATRGISNVMLAAQAWITVETGLVLCIVMHQAG